MPEIITTAQALNAFWDELSTDIPEQAREQLLIDAGHAIVKDGALIVKEPTDA